MTIDQKVRPGALVVDLLGDFSRAGGRLLRLKALVELGEDLGIPGPSMRVTLARLRERGWFDVRKNGRESIYELSPLALLAIHEGGSRIHRPAPERWDGNWSLLIHTAPDGDRHAREELRRELAWLGFGPLAPSTWIRPRADSSDVETAIARLPEVRLTLMTSRTSGLPADRELTERCWDLASLGEDYEEFIRGVHARMPAYRQAASSARDALVARVHLVHSYRRFTGRDPQLPIDLQPAGWQGERARELFEQAHSLLSADPAAHYVAVMNGAPITAR